MKVGPKRPSFFLKAHKFKNQGKEFLKKSVFLAKVLERRYKPHYSPYKVIVI
jgi:hypothetical protein